MASGNHPSITRRDLLVGGSATIAGTAIGGSVGWLAGGKEQAPPPASGNLINCHGEHQAGIEMPNQALVNFIALDLKATTTRSEMPGWMELLTQDIESLTSASPTLADPSPELARSESNLTVTVGFGPSMFEKLALGHLAPPNFAQIPKLAIDALRDEYSGGDVLIQVASNDPLALSNATRTLVRDSEYFAAVRWIQTGFSGKPIKGEGHSRNLMGQIDGTDNPELGSADFENLVWINGSPTWLRGGTQMVIRRIRMKLDMWDSLGREQKEAAIGRKLTNGAPLGSDRISDPPNFSLKQANGMLAIPEVAHIRRASSQNLTERFFRRPFNYSVQESPNEAADAGMLWVAYAKDLRTQYLPVQQRLAEFDLLNLWTEPIGSAVFAVPGGFRSGEFLAERLFT